MGKYGSMIRFCFVAGCAGSFALGRYVFPMMQESSVEFIFTNPSTSNMQGIVIEGLKSTPPEFECTEESGFMSPGINVTVPQEMANEIIEMCKAQLRNKQEKNDE